jgi:glycosyltransferase involved in cell wall biosynthesis
VTEISVGIVCRNEARKLGECLASVAWADEVIVMDLESTDESARVAEQRGARVLRHEPVPIVELVRNEVADAARGAWMLVLDPDERASPRLEQELRAASTREDVDAVVIPRTNVDFGHPPQDPAQRYEPQLRMYRRERVRWPTEPNRLPTVPEERLLRLPADDELVILHERNQSIPEVVERIMRYAPAEAQTMIDRGEVFTARAMFGTLGGKARRYFIQGRAFEDGVPGVMRAWTLLNFHFYVWAAFWQMSGAKRTAEDDAYARRIGRTLQALRWPYRAARAPARLVRRARR